jgi:hypothetical protein
MGVVTVCIQSSVRSSPETMGVHLDLQNPAETDGEFELKPTANSR